MSVPPTPRRALDTTDWIVPDWPVSTRVRAISTTRNGGISTGSYSSLNLGAATHDAPEAIVENRRRLSAHLPSQPIWLRQVHGVDTAIVDAENAQSLRADPPTADAAITRERNVVLGVLSADCLPILVAERNGTAIAVAHAGWRGLARGVVEHTIAAMAIDPTSLVAWLGPAIGRDAFEVGSDVQAAFVDEDPGAAAHFAPRRNGKWLADLRALAGLRLTRCGVHDIHGVDLCTHRDAARFYSYRRDGETGRMASLLWLDARAG